jgi:hypothetical protein
VLPRPDAPYLRRAPIGAAVAVVALGLSLGVLWELGEWYGDAHVDPRIQVGYDDTLGDLVAGGAGSLVAGVATALLATRRRRSTRPVEPPLVVRRAAR